MSKASQANRALPTPVPSRERLVATLRRSQIFRDYEEAFRQTTGLPLVLRSAEAITPEEALGRGQNPVCAVMAESRRTCATCLKLQKRLKH